MLKDQRILICKSCQNFPLLIESYNLKQIWECQVCDTVNHFKYQTQIINKQLTLIDDDFWKQYQKNCNYSIETTSIIFIEIGIHLNDNLFVESFKETSIQNNLLDQRKSLLILRLFEETQGVYIRNKNLKGFCRQSYQKRRNVSVIQYILFKIDQYINLKTNQTKNNLKKCQIVLFNGVRQQIIDVLQLKQEQINLFKSKISKHEQSLLKKNKQKNEQTFQILKANKQIVLFFRRLVALIYTKNQQSTIQRYVKDCQKKHHLLIDGTNKNNMQVVFYCQQFKLDYYELIIKNQSLNSFMTLQKTLQQRNIVMLIYTLSTEEIHQLNSPQKFSNLKRFILYENSKINETQNKKDKKKMNGANLDKQTNIMSACSGQDQYIIVFYSFKLSNQKFKSHLQSLKLNMVSEIKRLFIDNQKQQVFKRYLSQKQEYTIMQSLQQRIHQKLKNTQQKWTNVKNNLYKNDSICIHKIFCSFYNAKSNKKTQVKSNKNTLLLYVFDWILKIRQNFQNLDDLEPYNFFEQFKSVKEDRLKSNKQQQNKLINQSNQKQSDKVQQIERKIKIYQNKRRKSCLEQMNLCQIQAQQSDMNKYKNSFKKKKTHQEMQIQIKNDKQKQLKFQQK